MIVWKAVVFAVLLVATVNNVSGRPQSSIIRERHIIHAPIKFRVIHHYKIKKVPIIIKKHLHYHNKPETEKTKSVLEDIQGAHVYRDYSNGNSGQFDFHPQDDSKEYSSQTASTADSGFHPDFWPQEHRYEVPAKSPYENDHDSQEEDYEEPQESQEDYEYE